MTVPSAGNVTPRTAGLMGDRTLGDTVRGTRTRRTARRVAVGFTFTDSNDRPLISGNRIVTHRRVMLGKCRFSGMSTPTGANDGVRIRRAGDCIGISTREVSIAVNGGANVVSCLSISNRPVLGFHRDVAPRF